MTLCSEAVHGMATIGKVRGQVLCSQKPLQAPSPADDPPVDGPAIYCIEPSDLSCGTFEPAHHMHVQDGESCPPLKIQHDLRVWLMPKAAPGSDNGRARSGSGLEGTQERTHASTQSTSKTFRPRRAPVVRVEVLGECKRSRGMGRQTLTKVQATLWPHETTCTDCAAGKPCDALGDKVSLRGHYLVLVHATDLEDLDSCVQIADGILAFCQQQGCSSKDGQYAEKNVIVTFSDKVPAACWAGLPMDIQRHESNSGDIMGDESGGGGGDFNGGGEGSGSGGGKGSGAHGDQDS